MMFPDYANMCSQLRREAKEKEDLQATLRERTKMLKMYQSKVSFIVVAKLGN